MVDLWTTLLPLVIGSAVVPTQIVVTGVLLRSSRGKAVAWIAGMAGLRVLQGVLGQEEAVGAVDVARGPARLGQQVERRGGAGRQRRERHVGSGGVSHGYVGGLRDLSVH